MGSVVTTVTGLPLRRRLLGSLVVLLGLLLVLAGFFTDLAGASAVLPANADPAIYHPPAGSQGLVDSVRAGLTTGGDTAAASLRHILDHGLRSVTVVSTLSDTAARAGVVLMAAAGALALVLLVTPMRGLIGLAGGAGLVGVGLVTGVIVGTSTQLTDATTAGVHVTIGQGILLLGAGFAVVIVGGALAAFRPLAGLVTGVSLAVLGVTAAVGLAVLVGGDHALRGGPLPGTPGGSPGSEGAP